MNKNLERRITISTLVLATTFVLALGVWSLYLDRQPAGASSGEGSKSVSWELIPPKHDDLRQEPRPSRLATITLEEAQQKVQQFTIKVPNATSLPPGFSVRGATYAMGAPSDFRGEKFTPERVSLIFWNRSIPSDMIHGDLEKTEAIVIEMAYTRCTGNLDLYRQVHPNATVESKWGHEAAYADGFVELCNKNENMAYAVYGRYRSDALLKVMDSIVNG